MTETTTNIDSSWLISVNNGLMISQDKSVIKVGVVHYIHYEWCTTPNLLIVLN